MALRLLFLFVIYAGFSLQLQAQNNDSVTVIHAGRLIDTSTGRMLQNQVITIKNGLIESVEADDADEAGAQVIDLSDYTVMPGFIDAHTHMISAAGEDAGPMSTLATSVPQMAYAALPNARKMLESGFTTVRDLGNYRALIDVALRDAIENGDVIGPRMLVAGAFLTITGGSGAMSGHSPDITLPWDMTYGQADSPDEVREKIRALASQRVDVIKVFGSGAVLSHYNSPQTLDSTYEELKVAVDTARNFGLTITAHAHNADGIKNALRAGVDSIEHGSYLDAEGRRMMIKQGAYLVPTLSVQDCVNFDSGRFPEEFVRRGKKVMQDAQESFRHAVSAGVKIALGSDAVVCPFGESWREFIWMVRLGMTPMEAIQAATINGANLLNMQDKIGVIEAGMYADVVAVKGNPLEDVNIMEHINFVMKKGVIYKNN